MSVNGSCLFCKVVDCFFSRDAKLQEILWRYSVDCLENQVSEEMLEQMTVSADDIKEELEKKD